MTKKNFRITASNGKSWSLGLIASIVVLGMALPANAQGKTASGGSTGCSGHSGQSFNVTSILADKDNSNLVFQVQSDGKGSYVTYTNSNSDSDLSEIQAVSCDWVLELTHSQLRTMKVALGYPASSGAKLPSGWPTDGSTVNVPARIISKCELNSLNPGLSYGTMTYAGQTIQCGFYAAFVYNGSNYAVRMDPKNFAGTDWAQMTCTGATSNVCNAWTLTPIPNMVTNPYTGQPASISELEYVTVPGSIIGTSMGLYYVSFSMIVTK